MSTLSFPVSGISLWIVKKKKKKFLLHITPIVAPKTLSPLKGILTKCYFVPMQSALQYFVQYSTCSCLGQSDLLYTTKSPKHVINCCMSLVVGSLTAYHGQLIHKTRWIQVWFWKLHNHGHNSGVWSMYCSIFCPGPTGKLTHWSQTFLCFFLHQEKKKKKN